MWLLNRTIQLDISNGSQLFSFWTFWTLKCSLIMCCLILIARFDLQQHLSLKTPRSLWHESVNRGSDPTTNICCDGTENFCWMWCLDVNKYTCFHGTPPPTLNVHYTHLCKHKAQGSTKILHENGCHIICYLIYKF